MEKRSIPEGIRKKVSEITKIIEWMEKTGSVHPIDYDLILNKTRDLYSHVLQLSSQSTPEGTEPIQAPPREEVTVQPDTLTPPEEERILQSLPEIPEPTAKEPEIPDQVETLDFFRTVTPRMESEPFVKVAEEETPKAATPPPAEPSRIKPRPAAPPPPQSTPVSQPNPVTLFPREDSLNERLGKQKPMQDVASALVETPVADIWSAIAINDRFLFTRELFGNDSEAFKTTVSLLNSISSWEAAKKYISEHFTWDPNLPVAKDFLAIVRRRFL